METRKKVKDSKSDKEHVYKSMLEFEESFFPRSLKKRLRETAEDPRTQGTKSARESLDAVRQQLVK